MLMPVLLFTPAVAPPMEFLPVPLEFVVPTTEPAPNRFGCRRELRMCCVFMALE